MRKRFLPGALAPFLAALAFFGGVAAQGTGGSAELLAKARALAQEAQEAYAGTILNIDQPLWAQAVHTAEEALELEPGSVEALRFLAETYNTLAWDIRAWNYWNRYLEAGGALDEGASKGLSEAGTEMGFARYRAGDMQGALGYYQKVHALLPDDREALTWLGRIYFELGQPQDSLPYWQRLVELAPSDAGAVYYLERVQRQLQVGVDAESAFQAGIAAYQAGDKAGALSQFDRAARLSEGFREALSWAGRVSLELGRSQAAVSYWQQVLALDPTDDGAAYFLELAQDQVAWGADAAQAYHDGLALVQQGKPEEAAERFAAAVAANPKYEDAALQAARTYQQLGAIAKALPYWQRVLAIDPAHAEAGAAVKLAETQLRYGADAAGAFIQGLASYQRAEFDNAERYFRAAVEANPRYTEAWAWLGRIYFDQAEYARAADSYQRALELDPDNDAYGFFAGEARRLAPAAGTESR